MSAEVIWHKHWRIVIAAVSSFQKTITSTEMFRCSHPCIANYSTRSLLRSQQNAEGDIDKASGTYEVRLFRVGVTPHLLCSLYCRSEVCGLLPAIEWSVFVLTIALDELLSRRVDLWEVLLYVTLLSVLFNLARDSFQFLLEYLRALDVLLVGCLLFEVLLLQSTVDLLLQFSFLCFQP